MTSYDVLRRLIHSKVLHSIGSGAFGMHIAVPPARTMPVIQKEVVKQRTDEETLRVHSQMETPRNPKAHSSHAPTMVERAHGTVLYVGIHLLNEVASLIGRKRTLERLLLLVCKVHGSYR